MTSDDPILQLSVRELLERAAHLIVKRSTRGPDFDGRVDLFYDIDMEDPKLGRSHRVRVRLKVTATSLIFDKTSSEPTSSIDDL